jgi:hypothetical protein
MWHGRSCDGGGYDCNKGKYVIHMSDKPIQVCGLLYFMM